MTRILVAVMIMLLGIVYGGAYADVRDRYRPTKEGLPQIIQATDHSTIAASENEVGRQDPVGL
jgi:hypothetical protein